MANQKLEKNWDKSAIESIQFSLQAIIYIEQVMEMITHPKIIKILHGDIKRHERIISGRVQFLTIYNDY